MRLAEKRLSSWNGHGDFDFLHARFRISAMAVLCSLLVLSNPLPWQQRLRSHDSLQPPWHDHHPDRLAMADCRPAASLHLARTIDRLVDELSFADLVASYSGRGSTPHRPDLLLKAVLYLVP